MPCNSKLTKYILNFGMPQKHLSTDLIWQIEIKLGFRDYQPSPSHGCNAKIGLKNGPPWAEIFAKILLNMACQTKPQPHFVFMVRPRTILKSVSGMVGRLVGWLVGLSQHKFQNKQSTLPNHIPACRSEFLKYLGPGLSIFQTDFCIETVGLRRSFWVQ